MRTLSLLFWVFLFFCGTEQGQASADKKVLLNRSLLTVGSDVYSCVDLEIYLALWKKLTEEAEPAKVDFCTDFQLQDPVDGVSGFQKILTYPSDVRRLLYILLVWNESRRLNLFSPSAKRLESALGRFKDGGFSEFLSDRSQAFWQELSEKRRESYVDAIIRAEAYRNTRGDFEANQRLLETSWYWHF